jgi:hypothetical protein
VLAARDERDVLARFGEPAAEVAPDRPASEHRDAHAGFPRGVLELPDVVA